MYILLSGKRYSGKDTACKILKKIFGETCASISFADVAKSLYCEANEIENRFHEREFKELHRHPLISFCKLTKRICGEDVFANEVFAIKNSVLKVLIITDLRFEIEVETLKKQNSPYLVIRVYSDEENRKRRGWVYDPEIDDSPSECELDDYEFDIIVDNNFTEADLEQELRRIFCSD